MKTIDIVIFHDTVCPWCRIGKKNLLTALQESQKTTKDYNITYNTFFLHRDLPVEGVDYAHYLTSKFRGVSLQDINEGPTRMGKQAGINFNFDKISIIPNTILSNVLIYLTPADKKELLVDKLFELYFEKGENIGDIQLLVNLASEFGISVTTEQLQSERNKHQVLQQDEYGKKLGITGVPFFIFNEKYALVGAQPVSAFKNVIERIDGDIEVLL